MIICNFRLACLIGIIYIFIFSIFIQCILSSSIIDNNLEFNDETVDYTIQNPHLPNQFKYIPNDFRLQQNTDETLYVPLEVISMAGPPIDLNFMRRVIEMANSDERLSEFVQVRISKTSIADESDSIYKPNNFVVNTGRKMLGLAMAPAWQDPAGGSRPEAVSVPADSERFTAAACDALLVFPPNSYDLNNVYQFATVLVSYVRKRYSLGYPKTFNSNYKKLINAGCLRYNSTFDFCGDGIYNSDRNEICDGDSFTQYERKYTDICPSCTFNTHNYTLSWGYEGAKEQHLWFKDGDPKVQNRPDNDNNKKMICNDVTQKGCNKPYDVNIKPLCTKNASQGSSNRVVPSAECTTNIGITVPPSIICTTYSSCETKYFNYYCWNSKKQTWGECTSQDYIDNDIPCPTQCGTSVQYMPKNFYSCGYFDPKTKKIVPQIDDKYCEKAKKLLPQQDCKHSQYPSCTWNGCHYTPSLVDNTHIDAYTPCIEPLSGRPDRSFLTPFISCDTEYYSHNKCITINPNTGERTITSEPDHISICNRQAVVDVLTEPTCSFSWVCDGSNCPVRCSDCRVKDITRTVTCQSLFPSSAQASTIETVDNKFCDVEDLPQETLPCNDGCSYEWLCQITLDDSTTKLVPCDSVKDYKECQIAQGMECGSGTITDYSVKCTTRINNNYISVHDSLCEEKQLPKPSSSQTCLKICDSAWYCTLTPSFVSQDEHRLKLVDPLTDFKYCGNVSLTDVNFCGTLSWSFSRICVDSHDISVQRDDCDTDIPPPFDETLKYDHTKCSIVGIDAYDPKNLDYDQPGHSNTDTEYYDLYNWSNDVSNNKYKCRLPDNQTIATDCEYGTVKALTRCITLPEQSDDNKTVYKRANSFCQLGQDSVTIPCINMGNNIIATDFMPQSDNSLEYYANLALCKFDMGCSFVQTEFKDHPLDQLADKKLSELHPENCSSKCSDITDLQCGSTTLRGVCVISLKANPEAEPYYSENAEFHRLCSYFRPDIPRIIQESCPPSMRGCAEYSCRYESLADQSIPLTDMKKDYCTPDTSILCQHNESIIDENNNQNNNTSEGIIFSEQCGITDYSRQWFCVNKYNKQVIDFSYCFNNQIIQTEYIEPPTTYFTCEYHQGCDKEIRCAFQSTETGLFITDTTIEQCNITQDTCDTHDVCGKSVLTPECLVELKNNDNNDVVWTKVPIEECIQNNQLHVTGNVPPKHVECTNYYSCSEWRCSSSSATSALSLPPLPSNELSRSHCSSALLPSLCTISPDVCGQGRIERTVACFENETVVYDAPTCGRPGTKPRPLQSLQCSGWNGCSSDTVCAGGGSDLISCPNAPPTCPSLCSDIGEPLSPFTPSSLSSLSSLKVSSIPLATTNQYIQKYDQYCLSKYNNTYIDPVNCYGRILPSISENSDITSIPSSLICELNDSSCCNSNINSVIKPTKASSTTSTYDIYDNDTNESESDNDMLFMTAATQSTALLYGPTCSSKMTLTNISFSSLTWHRGTNINMAWEYKGLKGLSLSLYIVKPNQLIPYHLTTVPLSYLSTSFIIPLDAPIITTSNTNNIHIIAYIDKLLSINVNTMISQPIRIVTSCGNQISTQLALCGRHGKCPPEGTIDLQASDYCICDEGWSGPQCTISQCTPQTCLNGHCNGSHSQCICYDGYSGPRCEARIECEDNTTNKPLYLLSNDDDSDDIPSWAQEYAVRTSNLSEVVPPIALDLHNTIPTTQYVTSHCSYHGYKRPNGQVSFTDGDTEEEMCEQCHCLSQWSGEFCETCMLRCSKYSTIDPQCQKCTCAKGYSGQHCECYEQYFMAYYYNATQFMHDKWNDGNIDITQALTIWKDSIIRDISTDLGVSKSHLSLDDYGWTNDDYNEWAVRITVKICESLDDTLYTFTQLDNSNGSAPHITTMKTHEERLVNKITLFKQQYNKYRDYIQRVSPLIPMKSKDIIPWITTTSIKTSSVQNSNYDSDNDGGDVNNTIIHQTSAVMLSLFNTLSSLSRINNDNNNSTIIDKYTTLQTVLPTYSTIDLLRHKQGQTSSGLGQAMSGGFLGLSSVNDQYCTLDPSSIDPTLEKCSKVAPSHLSYTQPSTSNFPGILIFVIVISIIVFIFIILLIVLWQCSKRKIGCFKPKKKKTKLNTQGLRRMKDTSGTGVGSNAPQQSVQGSHAPSESHMTEMSTVRRGENNGQDYEPEPSTHRIITSRVPEGMMRNNTTTTSTTSGGGAGRLRKTKSNVSSRYKDKHGKRQTTTRGGIKNPPSFDYTADGTGRTDDDHPTTTRTKKSRDDDEITAIDDNDEVYDDFVVDIDYNITSKTSPRNNNNNTDNSQQNAWDDTAIPQTRRRQSTINLAGFKRIKNIPLPSGWIVVTGPGGRNIFINEDKCISSFVPPNPDGSVPDIDQSLFLTDEEKAQR